MTQRALLTLFGLVAAGPAFSFDWMTNELYVKYGVLDIPTFAGGGDQGTLTLGTQHADGWKYGDNYFFLDFTDAEKTGSDIYGEYYGNFSLGKITGKTVSFGPMSDVGLLAGFNYGREAKVRKYLPGIRLSWNIPGFRFFNTDITAYIDGSDGAAAGGAPEEDDSYMVDFNWAYAFEIGKHSFSIEGHVEYIGERDNEFGDEVSWHILGQPQFRYDLGKALFSAPEHLYVGTEWQFWINKLGDSSTDESALQLIVVGRF